MSEPVLYIIATPIGNLEDITLRAIRILGEIDVLACEDTRRTKNLLKKHDIPYPSKIISYREKNEKNSVPGIIKLLESGSVVGVTSDAGYPGISDAGYRLISSAIENGIRVEVIPGASAIPVALLSSGLPTDSYTFLGFSPKKKGARSRMLEDVRDLNQSLVIYESPYRTHVLLRDAMEVLGDRLACVAIEMTKMHERFHRGYLSDLGVEFDGKKIKGEVTVVIAGNNPKFHREE